MHSVTQLWLTWKSSIKTKSRHTKPCPAELSPRIKCHVSPFLPKMSKNCCTHKVWTVPPFPWTFMGNLGDGEKSYPSAKNLLIFPIRKIPLNRFKSFAIKSFICSCSHFCCTYFKFQALCTHVHAKHEKSIEWLKLYGNQNFCSLPPVLFVILLNSAFIIACFPLFHTPFFISHFIKFQLTPLQLGFCGL